MGERESPSRTCRSPGRAGDRVVWWLVASRDELQRESDGRHARHVSAHRPEHDAILEHTGLWWGDPDLYRTRSRDARQ
jgi:hypothetical protein